MRRTRPQNLPQNVLEVLRFNGDEHKEIFEKPDLLATMENFVEGLRRRKAPQRGTDIQKWRQDCEDVASYAYFWQCYIPTDKFPVQQYMALARDWDFEPRLGGASRHGLTPTLYGLTPPVVVRPDIPMPTPDRRNEIDFGRFPFWLTRQHGAFVVECGPGKAPANEYSRRIHPHIVGGNRICGGGWNHSLNAANERNDLLSYMEYWYNALLMIDDPTRNSTEYTLDWFGRAALCDICGRFIGCSHITKDPTARSSSVYRCCLCGWHAVCSYCSLAAGVKPAIKCRSCRFSAWGYKWPKYAVPTYEVPCSKCGDHPWETLPVKVDTEKTAWICLKCTQALPVTAAIKIRHYFQTRNAHGETDTTD